MMTDRAGFMFRSKLQALLTAKQKADHVAAETADCNAYNA